MKQQKTALGSFFIVSSIMMILLLSIGIGTKTAVYAGASTKDVPASCMGANGEVPAEYTVSGEHVSGSGANVGSVTIQASGTTIEVDYVPMPPFTTPTVACVETDTSIYDWQPINDPNPSVDGSGGVTIETGGTGYPIYKQALESVRTIWMVWGPAPYSIYIPITVD